MNVFARDLAMALDAAVFSRLAGVDPDPWQARVLRSTASAVLMNCSRQSGKSSVAAILAIHTALYSPGSLILLLSPSLRQSQELFRKALDVYRSVGRTVPPTAESALRLELQNDSRIVSLPGTESSIRGYSAVNLLVVDEAARVDDGLFYAIRPMLAVSAGRLVTLSTPAGKRGWWHEAWANGGAAWERYEVPASMCERIPAAFLAEEKKALPGPWYRQEYCCSFEETDSSLFSADLIQSAFDPSILPLFGNAA